MVLFTMFTVRQETLWYYLQCLQFDKRHYGTIYNVYNSARDIILNILSNISKINHDRDLNF